MTAILKASATGTGPSAESLNNIADQFLVRRTEEQAGVGEMELAPA